EFTLGCFWLNPQTNMEEPMIRIIAGGILLYRYMNSPSRVRAVVKQRWNQRLDQRIKPRLPLGEGRVRAKAWRIPSTLAQRSIEPRLSQRERRGIFAVFVF